MSDGEPGAYTFRPIGVAHTPFRERVDAPRQATEAPDVVGTIELYPDRGYEDALDGLSSFSHVWVLFVFDRNEGVFRPKVLPPRSRVGKVGVFASRSPHRPNPIGMSVVELVRIEGRILHVRGLDILDGSPVLDLKPYIAYADARPEASQGWLVQDPAPPWNVVFTPEAEEQVAWVEAHGVSLRAEIQARLALGPQPHAYRRIKVESDGRARLAWKDWRIVFRADEPARTIVVLAIATGYRPSQLASAEQSPELHRAFAGRFPLR